MPAQLPRVGKEWRTPRSRVLTGPYHGRVLSAALSCRSCSPTRSALQSAVKGGGAPRAQQEADPVLDKLSTWPGSGRMKSEGKEGGGPGAECSYQASTEESKRKRAGGLGHKSD